MGQDRAEALDDDKLGAEVAPDEPLGVEEYGTTAAEERVGEPLAERVAREVPDDVALDGPGPSDGSDVSADDDIATEREAPPPAEETALHVERPS